MSRTQHKTQITKADFLKNWKDRQGRYQQAVERLNAARQTKPTSKPKASAKPATRPAPREDAVPPWGKYRLDELEGGK